MTRLICEAVNCGNNHEHLCCLDEIEVCGCDAQTRDCTCCGSFIEGRHATMSAFGDISASAETEIACEAEACVYNSDGMCSALNVEIDGSYAHRMDATLCRTFKKA